MQRPVWKSSPRKPPVKLSSGASPVSKAKVLGVLTGLNPSWPNLNVAEADFKTLCLNFPLS
jgi:hypothetical protein